MINVSVVIPTYNREKTLKKCIDSLINQTLKNIEIIIIDDGSNDNTSDLILNYTDERIKYFKRKNHGIGSSRNFGIEKSSGEYLCFVDSDDYVSKDYLEKMYNKAITDELDLVVCDYYDYYLSGRKKEVKLENFNNSNLKENPKLIRIINLGPCNKLIKKSLTHNNKFLEETKYEDAPFVTKIIKEAQKIGKLNESLCYFLKDNKSETTVRDERIFDILKVVKIIRKQFEKEEYIKEELNKLTVRILTNYTIQQRNQEFKKIGLKFIDEVFKYLKEEIPDYKNNKYYESRGIIRRTIEKNKTLTKIYCILYKK